MWALEGEDEECVRYACGIVSDIAIALGENVNQYLSSFTPQLLGILKDQNRDQETKLTAIGSLGDLAIHAGVSFCQLYLTDTLRLLDSAMKLSTSIQGFENDPDTLAFLDKLRMALIEVYTTITQGVKDSKMQQAFSEAMPGLFDFIQKVVQIKDMETYKYLAGLLGDLADCMGQNIAPYLNQPWVRQVLGELQRQNS